MAVAPRPTENAGAPVCPVTVTRLEPGPSITSGPAVSESVSVPRSAIVWGVEKTFGSKLITLPAGLVRALA